MADFIVRPPIWQFAFLEFSYLLLSSAASIAPAAISIANVALTTGQYTGSGIRIHIHIHIAVHNRLRIHIRTHIAIHTRTHGDAALAAQGKKHFIELEGGIL